MKKVNYYTNKTILVTGGAGSIGSAIVKNLILSRPASIRILDNNESGVFDFTRALSSPLISPLIGDIRDEKRIATAMRDVDVVFHAAALKHVPLSEYNPIEAIHTNILGTQNVITSAIQTGVKKVINISTDKAVHPVNVMGATKLVAERLITNAHHYLGKKKSPVFCSVRFGNVLHSSGSVLPIFEEQIQRGGPVTITSKEMTRFFMKISDAADFIVKAGILAKGREIFIPKMPALRIDDLANALIENVTLRHGKNAPKIRKKIIGIRPGEKLYESLITSEEAMFVHENNSMFILRYPLSHIKAINVTPRENYNSMNARLLDKNQIKKILSQVA